MRYFPVWKYLKHARGPYSLTLSFTNAEKRGYPASPEDIPNLWRYPTHLGVFLTGLKISPQGRGFPQRTEDFPRRVEDFPSRWGFSQWAGNILSPLLGISRAAGEILDARPAWGLGKSSARWGNPRPCGEIFSPVRKNSKWVEYLHRMRISSGRAEYSSLCSAAHFHL